jgi:hypothetical protein
LAAAIFKTIKANCHEKRNQDQDLLVKNIYLEPSPALSCSCYFTDNQHDILRSGM